MNANRKYIWIPLVLIALMSVLFWNIGYHTPREEFTLLFGQYFLLFGLFYLLWLNKAELSFGKFLIIALVFRLILLPAYPFLTEDYFRFIWDGELLTRGVNPFAHTPNELISHSAFMADDYMRRLYHGMSTLSQENYSCYPVLNQLFFLLPAWLTESVISNILILKSFMIAADIGVIFIGKKILEKINRPTHYIWLYALNPFIIIEFTGNIHFEGVMIFFLLLSIWFVMNNKWILSAAFLGFAVQVKLIPLILTPFVFKKLGWRKSLGFMAMLGITVLFIGRLMLDEAMLQNMNDSIGNYFRSFEFNAGLFTLVQEIGFAIKGYDIVSTVGPILRNIAIAGIMLLALFRKYKSDEDIIKGMMFALVIWFSFATTVHPWYISSILVLSVFTGYKFGLIWSFLAMLSYFAYSNPAFKENYWLLAAEYLGVYLILTLEIIKTVKSDNFGLQLGEFFSSPRKKDE